LSTSGCTLVTGDFEHHSVIRYGVDWPDHAGRSPNNISIQHFTIIINSICHKMCLFHYLCRRDFL